MADHSIGHGMVPEDHRMKMPDVKWILWNRILMPPHRAEWLKGSVKKDGFKWKVRGVKDSYLAYGAHEKHLEHMMSGIRGSLFLDIGAHVGRWTLHNSRTHQQVVAFEPHPKNYKLLLENIRENKVKNIQAHNVALSDGDGYAPLREYGRGTSSSSLLSNHPKEWWSGPPFLEGRESGHIIVQTRTLDSYQLQPSFVKIDTEGWEIPVLEGGAETLSHYLPRVLVEIHLKHDLERIPQFLKEIGYGSVELLKHPHEMHFWAEK